MSEQTTTASTNLHERLSRAGKKGAARQPHEAKVAGGLAGSAARWTGKPLCPSCKRGATPEQIKAGKFIRKK